MPDTPEGRGKEFYVARFRPIVDDMIDMVDAMSLVIRDAEEAFVRDIQNKLEGKNDKASFEDRHVLEGMIAKLAKAKVFGRLLKESGLEENRRNGIYDRYLDQLFWVPGRAEPARAELSGDATDLLAELRDEIGQLARRPSNRRGGPGKKGA